MNVAMVAATLRPVAICKRRYCQYSKDTDSRKKLVEEEGERKRERVRKNDHR